MIVESDENHTSKKMLRFINSKNSEAKMNSFETKWEWHLESGGGGGGKAISFHFIVD